MPTVQRNYFASLLYAALLSINAGITADPYTLGSQSYSKGDYKTALGFFQKAAAMYPTNAVVHYQLANTYMQLRQLGEAKAEYNRCLGMNPDPTTAKYCHRFLDAYSGGGKTSASAAAAPAASAGASHGESDLDRRKREILTQAQQQAQTIRADAENRIKELDQGSNMLVRDPTTGEVKTGVAGSQADAIRSEAEAKAKEIIDRAEDKVKHMQ